jgi:formate hydrogenlyase subunit 6/NADH:ubiquinone oxidoreductase subunit I
MLGRMGGIVMTSSVFSTIAEYFKNLFQGIRSVMRSSMTALPYLLNVNSGDLRKEVTEQYPDPVSSRTADDLPPRSRGLLYNDIERCTGCRECEKVCPVDCITIETELGADSSKTWVSVFDIDFARCIFCGLCVEACAPASLVHTKQYEGAVYSLPDLVASFGRGRVTPEQRSKWALARQAKEED